MVFTCGKTIHPALITVRPLSPSSPVHNSSSNSSHTTTWTCITSTCEPLSKCHRHQRIWWRNSSITYQIACNTITMLAVIDRIRLVRHSNTGMLPTIMLNDSIKYVLMKPVHILFPLSFSLPLSLLSQIDSLNWRNLDIQVFWICNLCANNIKNAHVFISHLFLFDRCRSQQQLVVIIRLCAVVCPSFRHSRNHRRRANEKGQPRRGQSHVIIYSNFF